MWTSVAFVYSSSSFFLPLLFLPYLTLVLVVSQIQSLCLARVSKKCELGERGTSQAQVANILDFLKSTVAAYASNQLRALRSF